MSHIDLRLLAREGLAIESLPVAAYLIDPSGLITHYNDCALELWGRTPEIGERWCGSYRLFSTAGQPIDLVNCPMAHYMRTGAFPPLDTAILERPNGEFRRIKPHASVIKGESGELIGFLNLVVDVTQTREKTTCGTDLEELLDSILSADAIGFTIFDYEQEKTVKANDHFLEILGVSRAEFELEEASCYALTPPEYRDRDRAAVQEARIRGFWSAFEKEFERPDGTRIAVRISSAPIPHAPGHCLVCIEDVTSSKKAEKEVELLRAEVHHLSRLSAMGTMTSVLAHEVAQPFAVIKNALGAIACGRGQADEALLQDAIASALNLIEREADRGYRLVESMRNFSKPNRSKMQIVDLDRLIRDIVELALLRAPQVSLAINIGKSARFAFGDPVQIEQVFLNIVRNSIEAMNLRGTIEIETRLKGDKVQIGVRDDGPGFSKESMATAFQPFSSSKADGMGLGLSICRSIIEQHGGKLLIVPSDRGAHLSFSFPFRRADSEKPPQ